MSIVATVSYVEMATRYQPPPRRTRVPIGRPTTLAEAHYAQRVIAWIGDLAVDLRTLPRLFSEPRHDAIRTDESRHGGRVRSRTAPVRRKAERDLLRLEPEIERAGGAVAASHKEVLARQTRAALGVDVPTADRRIPSAIDGFVSKNLTRIRSLSDKLIGEVEAIVIDAWDKGLSEAEVAAAIEARIGVAETYARFLARDQMTALYAQVTRARHEELGVRLFQWWTQGDGKVRHTHAVKHKKIFPYEGSRAPSFFPGDERGCRCWEVPVFDEIKAKLFADKGRTRAV